MRKDILFILSLLSAAILAGCADDKLPDYSKLDRLRVLAMVASQPEANPGTTGITITPWISDPNGNGRTLSYVAEGCIDPGVAYGAEPTCRGSASLTSLGAGAITGLSAPHYTGNSQAISVDLPGEAVIFASRSAIDQFNGVGYLVTFSVSATDGANVRAFRRLLVSGAAKTSKNGNPGLSDILSNGASLATLPTGAVELTAQIDSGAAETYTALSVSGTSSRSEQLTTTWFSTQGQLRFDRTEPGQATRWTPSGEAQALLIGVLRDNRGGVAVLSRAL